MSTCERASWWFVRVVDVDKRCYTNRRNERSIFYCSFWTYLKDKQSNQKYPLAASEMKDLVARWSCLESWVTVCFRQRLPWCDNRYTALKTMRVETMWKPDIHSATVCWPRPPAKWFAIRMRRRKWSWVIPNDYAETELNRALLIILKQIGVDWVEDWKTTMEDLMQIKVETSSSRVIQRQRTS